MNRWLVALLLIIMAGLPTALAQDSIPLNFIYDDEYEAFYAFVEIDAGAGDTLSAQVMGAEDLEYYVYDDEADLYEGEALWGFVVPADGWIYVEVWSLTEASGTLTVTRSAPPPPPEAAPVQTVPQPAIPDIQPGQFVEGPCPFDVPSQVTVTCGSLGVPENRLLPESRTIVLAAAVISALSPSPQPDPIFYLEGGPGGSALYGIADWYTSPHLEERDIVLLEQRGTAFSQPHLACPELSEMDDPYAATDVCRDRLLAEGVDLAAYNTRENAADVEALRRALGYDQINLYGISYGTRLALNVMRDHPDGLRAVVLDGVYPPNVNTNYTVVADTYQLFSNMFADCASQPACAAAFPDLEARFYDHLEVIGETLPEVTDEEGEVFELWPEDVLDMLQENLMVSGMISAVPASLDAFARGDYEAFMELATYGAPVDYDDDELAYDLMLSLDDDELADIEALLAQDDTDAIADYLSELFDLTADESQSAAVGFAELASSPAGLIAIGEMPDIDDDSDGMFMSVQCNEEIAFMSLDEAIARAEAVTMPDLLREVLLDTIVSEEFDDCDRWPAGQADAVENAPVVSDIPTLVLNAAYDTATPPWWGDLAAETLSASYNYTFPMVGHGVISGGDCPLDMGLAFIDDPYAEPDASCISAMDTAFYVP